MLICGPVQFVVSLILPFTLGGLSEEQATGIYGLCVAVLMLGGLVPVVVLSMRHARRLAEEYGEDDSPNVP